MTSLEQISELASSPQLRILLAELTSDWPEHREFLLKGVVSRPQEAMRVAESNARRIRAILAADGVGPEQLRSDYRELCDRLLEEELYFRRNGAYRLRSFAEALDEVYSKAEFMRKYMNFLLVSQATWENHVRSIAQFELGYLPRLRGGADHLEIGPGHGLLLQIASDCPSIRSLTGWDVSETSVAHTRQCMEAAGARRSVRLAAQNLFDAAEDAWSGFDSIVLSEVLEHLENPVEALSRVRRYLRDDGLVWINVPVNSPAPDHIYLLRTSEEAVDLVKAGGFDPLAVDSFAMTGATLERARRHSLTISVCITARKSV
jgi:2-polyprenyl-3-methyl-5-hydroxy-6-metoxy-1,4-benzoquinol methylase